MKMSPILVRTSASGLVLLCTVQALYCPLIWIPGTQLAWWQSRTLATVGYLLGFPALILSPWFGPRGAWPVAVTWAIVVYWLIRTLQDRSSRNPV